MSTVSKDSLRSLKAKHKSMPGNNNNNQNPLSNVMAPKLKSKASSSDDVLMNSNNYVETRRSVSNSSMVPDDMNMIRNSNNTNTNNINSNLPDIINAPSSSSNRDRDRSNRRSQGQRSSNEMEIGFSYEVGLTNLGNTCFMNCVLQNLFYTRPLMAYFIKAQHCVDLNIKSPKKGAIANSFADLVKDYLTATKRNCNVYEPKAFKKSLAHHAPHLLDYQQQDAQEFLRFLLNEMAEDLCRQPQIANGNTNSNGNGNNKNNGESNVNMNNGGTSPLSNNLPGINSSPTSISNPNLNGNGSSSSSSNSNNVSPSATVNKLRDMTLATRNVGEGPPIELVDLNYQNNNIPKSNSSYNNGNGNGLRIDVDIGDDPSMPMSQLTPSRPKGERSSSRKSLGSVRIAPSSNTSSSSLNGNSTTTNATEEQPQDLLSVAKQSWTTYLKYNDSVITDIFGGQLQSTVECLTCHNRTWCFDPFLDLSVPIPRSVDTNSVTDANGNANSNSDGSSTPGTGDNTPTNANTSANSGGGMGLGGFAKKMLPRVGRGGSSNGGVDPAAQTYPRRRMNSRKEPELKSCSLEDCLRKFTAQEFLDEENQITCDKCKTKRKCTKTLSLFKLPQYMVIHLKRFNFSAYSRDKVNTDVLFPMSELDMSPYISTDAPSSIKDGALYDLVGVSHHSGGLNGGHYTAHVDVTGGDSGVHPSWRFFNDARVSQVNTNPNPNPSVGGGNDNLNDAARAGIGGPSAYMLFYRMRQEKLITI